MTVESPISIDPQHWKFKHGNRICRKNYLKAALFQNPDWVPCGMSIFDAVWKRHRLDLAKVVERHPFVFGPYAGKRRNFDHISDWHTVGLKHDNWGCTWQVVKEGFEGQVIEHPLADWNALDAYKFPDPLKFSERGRHYWRGMGIGYWLGKKVGVITSGSGERLFDRLYFLRGFDNLMRDFARKDPHLPILLQRFQDHEMTLIKKWLSYKPDQINFHTDIGTQDRLMISPPQFRKYIKPLFKVLFQTCREGGAIVYLSSDGYLLDIVDDLVECGCTIHDPQEGANTIEGIARCYKGKMCVDLDIDRQTMPFATPDALKKQIKRAVETLNSPEGGLMLKAEMGDPNIPLENIEAICQAFEEYCIPKC